VPFWTLAISKLKIISAMSHVIPVLLPAGQCQRILTQRRLSDHGSALGSLSDSLMSLFHLSPLFFNCDFYCLSWSIQSSRVNCNRSGRSTKLRSTPNAWSSHPAWLSHVISFGVTDLICAPSCALRIWMHLLNAVIRRFLLCVFSRIKSCLRLAPHMISVSLSEM
jgi:hypothetical protein